METIVAKDSARLGWESGWLITDRAIILFLALVLHCRLVGTWIQGTA